MRKHWANPNWGTFYKIHEQLFQKKDGNCHRLKETKETWQLNATGSLGSDLGKEEGHYGKTGEIQIKSMA